MLCLVTQYFVNKRPDTVVYLHAILPGSQALHAIPPLGEPAAGKNKERQEGLKTIGQFLSLPDSHVPSSSPQQNSLRLQFPVSLSSDYAKTVRAGIICVYAPLSLPSLLCPLVSSTGMISNGKN